MVVCPPGCSETKVRKTRSDKGVKRGPRKKPQVKKTPPRPKRAPPPRPKRAPSCPKKAPPRPKKAPPKGPTIIEATYKVLAPLGPRKKPTLAEKTDNLQKNRVRAKIRKIFKDRTPAAQLAFIKSVDNYTLEDLRAALKPGSRKFPIYR